MSVSASSGSTQRNGKAPSSAISATSKTSTAPWRKPAGSSHGSGSKFAKIKSGQREVSFVGTKAVEEDRKKRAESKDELDNVTVAPWDDSD